MRRAREAVYNRPVEAFGAPASIDSRMVAPVTETAGEMRISRVTAFKARQEVGRPPLPEPLAAAESALPGSLLRRDISEGAREHG